MKTWEMRVAKLDQSQRSNSVMLHRTPHIAVRLPTEPLAQLHWTFIFLLQSVFISLSLKRRPHQSCVSLLTNRRYSTGLAVTSCKWENRSNLQLCHLCVSLLSTGIMLWLLSARTWRDSRLHSASEISGPSARLAYSSGKNESGLV